jgi:LysM repeat protein
MSLGAVCLMAVATLQVSGQTLTRSPAPGSDEIRLDAIAKKLDEQNAKIDLLSQEILKLEQQIANTRPGVMIGEATPAPSAASASPSASEGQHTPNGTAHTVARGETLTSIAKLYNVTASELQKFNHIENDRKLQIGQTILIPGGATPAPSPSASPSTN